MKKITINQILTATLIIASTLSAKGQSLALTLSSPNICLGSQLSLNATLTNLPTGITANNCTFDFNNDDTIETTISSGGPNYITQHSYIASGNYTIKAEVNLSNGSKVSQTVPVVVYRLPIPAATLNSQATQCFKGNLVTLTNSSVKTDNGILKVEVNWGDSSGDSYSNPFLGQNYTHAYTKSGQFNLLLKVTDSLGCSKDTLLHIIGIRQKINPSLIVLGSAGCSCTPFLLQNTTTQMPFNQVNSYTWDFGDGQKYTRSRPWNLPLDQYRYDTIWHTYCKNGTFLPSLTIQDTNGCIDTFSILKESAVNKPRNIVLELNPTPYITIQDTANHLRRDSVCYGNQGSRTLTFVQKPNPEINLVNGELLWNFGDPLSQPNNFNQNSWNPTHTFISGLGTYNVNLRLWPLMPNQNCRKDTTIVIDVLGPRARIEDPQNQITLNPIEQNQCNPNSGYYNVINFVNTAQYYKSKHVFRRWDFGDDVAPQCTSYLVPKTGFPPSGSWTTAQNQYNFSDGYWRQGGKVYEGKRLDCRYSTDTLPMHRYTSWDVIYRWYRYGHDFMPWNPQQYTRNPADTLPTANPRKILVHPSDTLWWGKPVYLNPATGAWSLVQGNGPAPYGLWPRIDTIPSVDENGQTFPQDLRPYNRFTLQNGAPDPMAGFWGNTKRGGYGFFPKGFVVDPLNDTMMAKYTSVQDESFRHHYESMVDPTRTLYQYLFDKAVQKCHQVEQFLQDSINNVGNKTHLVVNDFSKLDSLDCSDNNQVQLKLMRPDATGLGIKGKECPGSYTGPDRAGIQFMIGAVDNTLGQYSGISPDCGASFIRINLDSMADRRDQTPCALDGFINYTGATGSSPQPGGIFSITPGGLTYPPFSLQPDYNQYFLPPNRWNAPDGNSFWYHYGADVTPRAVSPLSNITFIPPANPTGDITIGLIVGTGDPNNPCISDTVWYHNLLNITDLDARFYVDPVYAPVTNIATNGACKYYCKNDLVNFVYLDSIQPFIGSSTINWGDNSITVDSFYYSPKPSLTDGFFVNGFRRVRYNYYFGGCGEDTVGTLIDSIPFPHGLPGVNATIRYINDYAMRLYHATSNPNGSLIYVGKVATNDSTIWQECGKQFIVANFDTLKFFYRTEEIDPAKMLLPVNHKYWSSSYDADCKKSGSTPRPISHRLQSTKECRKEEVDTKLLVRGVIDSVMARDARGNFDNVFCKEEPVHFYDSVRYYRNDCALTHPLFNPNYNPKTNQPYAEPFGSYHYDTINYWRDGSLSSNNFYPNGDFIEKIKYYFGDGDSATVSNPIHKYKQPGVYIVTMLSRDKNGCWDTSSCKVTITGLTNNSRAGFSINYPIQCSTGNLFVLNDTSTSVTQNYSRTWVWNNKSDTQAQLNLSFPIPGTYPITLKTAFSDGCIDSTSSILTVLPSPKAGFNINNRNQCKNNNLFILTDTSTTSGTLTRMWSWDNDTSSQTSLALSFMSVGTKLIKLKTTSNNGCSDSTSNLLTILPSPNVGFTINNNTQCENNNLFILVDTSSITSGNFSRIWSWDNNTSTQSNLNLSFNSAGTKSIKLKVAAADGCSDSIIKTVVVNAKPTIGNITGPTTVLDTQLVYDYNLIQQPNHTYNWNVTNGTITTGQGTNAIKVKWTSHGTGIVESIITNSNGCNDSALLIVSVGANAPAITSFTPQTGTNGTLITINGNNLNNASAVLFGGVNAKSFNIVSPSVITAIVDTGATGNVSVVTPNGTALLTGFTYINNTGIAEFLTQSYSIFPNPVSTEIIIESDKTLNNTGFELMDVNGKVLMSTTCNHSTNQFNIDVKTLSPAVYLLRITSQGQTSTVKVVKQ